MSLPATSDGRATPGTSLLARLLIALTASYALLALLVNGSYGRADVGDFGRVMMPYVQKPYGHAVGFPDSTDPWCAERFSNYWLPFWTPEDRFGHGKTLFTSNHLFWGVGKLLSAIFGAQEGMVELRLFGVVFQAVALLLLGALALLGARAASSSRKALAWSALFVPACLLLFSDVTVVTLFNSFYQEPAAYIGLLGIVLSLCFGWLHPDRAALAWRCVGLFALLLATAKIQYCYVGLLAGLALLLGWLADRYAGCLRKREVGRLALIGLLFMSALQPVILSDAGARHRRRCNAFNALFQGVLMYARSPREMLEVLGIPEDAQRHIGSNPYSPETSQLIESHRDRFTMVNVARAIAREPHAFLSELHAVSLHLRPLPLQGAVPHVPGMATSVEVGLGLWSRKIDRILPSGFAAFLGASLIALGAAVGALRCLKRRERLGFRLIATLLLGSFVTGDCLVSAFAEGLSDVVKHLQVGYLSGCLLFVLLLSWAIQWAWDRAAVR